MRRCYENIPKRYKAYLKFRRNIFIQRQFQITILNMQILRQCEFRITISILW